VYISRLGGARFGLLMPTGRICTHLCWLVLCVQGEFYAPMSFNAFPFDTQYLSVQMQYGNKFPNSPVRIVPSGARGDSAASQLQLLLRVMCLLAQLAVLSAAQLMLTCRYAVCCTSLLQPPARSSTPLPLAMSSAGGSSRGCR
jgi:hypothetical protein